MYARNKIYAGISPWLFLRIRNFGLSQQLLQRWELCL